MLLTHEQYLHLHATLSCRVNRFYPNPASRIYPTRRHGKPWPAPAQVKAEPTGVPSEAEVVAFLRASGRVNFDEFTRKYKKRVPTPEQRKQLVEVVKRVARIRPLDGSDVKYVVLKNAK
jgi:hypothetical protein